MKIKITKSDEEPEIQSKEQDSIIDQSVNCNGGTAPVIVRSFTLPHRQIELFFDSEADPAQDIVYLHGVVERRDGYETFHTFFAEECYGVGRGICVAAVLAIHSVRLRSGQITTNSGLQRG